MRSRSVRVTFLLIAVLISMSAILYSAQTAEAGRLAKVGGYRIIISGCINTPEDIAKMLFMWSPVDTKVVTHNPYSGRQQVEQS